MDESSDQNQFESDFNTLQTRAAQHTRNAVPPTDTHKTSKRPTRQNIIKCNEHFDNKDSWMSVNTECKLCTRFGILEVEDVKECVLP